MTLAELAPEAADDFIRRMRHDRAAIAALAKEIAVSPAWPRLGAPLAAIEGLAHRLAGAAGTFGHHPVSERALAVERVLERWRRRPPPSFTAPRRAILRRRIAALLAALDDAATAAGP